jgi:PAS domain S-box-containing protein
LSPIKQHPWVKGIRRRIGRWPRSFAVLRYVGTLGGVVGLTQLIHLSSLPRPIGGVAAMTAVLVFAWIGGLGPALLMSPLLLFLSRLVREEPERWIAMTSQESMGLAVVMLVTASTGLAGQYRRRIRAVTEQHAQKLRDQSRALNQAPIVFRSTDGRITEWHEGAERLCGWTADEAQGRMLHELLATRFPQPLEVIEAELARTGQWRGEVMSRHKNGSELHVAAHWILYRDNEDNPIGVAEVLSDVTELRRAEAAVREADQRKDEFLAMLAHELRNPLAPIRTGLELLRLVQDDPKQIETTREIMERQMKQLVTLVDDLLDVSRITRGKLELRKTSVALRDVVSTAVEAAQPGIDVAGHKLTVTLPTSDIYLQADPHRLAQVISNLLDNAAKYTPPGGAISLVAEGFENDVVVTVTDNGVGIPPDMLERVFEMFTRSSQDSKVQHAGLGIGLALVKQIVEMHGGQVEARSEGRGRGAQFILRLPILEEAPAIVAIPDAPEEPAGQAKRRVLIVDDNVDAVRVLSVVVKKLGNEVCLAYDGVQAIAAAEQFLPEVVLLDLGMPKLDGYGAARHIRQQPWGQEMTLIALTGWGQDTDKQRTKAAGFDHHLVKPADPAELRRLLVNGRQCAGSTKSNATTTLKS